jgi:hypothetical protein
MADSSLPPAGDYELLAARWDEITKTDSANRPLDWVTHTRGDIVTLSQVEAYRLLRGPTPAVKPSTKRQENNANVQAAQAVSAFPAAAAAAVSPVPASADGTPVVVPDQPPAG